MKILHTSSLIILTFFVLLSHTQNARALTPLSAKELAQHCAAYQKSPNSDAAQFCIRYIQGFIDGAIATDAQVMLNIEAEYNKDPQTLTERALSTRGARESSEKRVEKYAEYCLGEELKLSEIVNKIVEQLDHTGKIDATILARRFVYGSLKKHYPCEL